MFFLSFFVSLCDYTRVIPAIEKSGSAFAYWGLMIFGVVYLIFMSALLVYMNFFLQKRKYYSEGIVKLLRVMIILLNWVFYMPFFESFLSITLCNNGIHYIDTSLVCWEGVHIFILVFAMIFLIILFVNNIIIGMLYNETQPV